MIYPLASVSQESRTVVIMSVVADSGFLVSVLQLQWFQTCSSKNGLRRWSATVVNSILVRLKPTMLALPVILKAPNSLY